MDGKKWTVAERLAKFASETKFSTLKPEVIHQTKRLVLDQIGCMIGARGLPSSEAMLGTVTELGGRRESTIFGYGIKTNCAMAALANGTMGHSLEMDDIHNRGTVHPGVAIIPSTFAVGEKHGITGKDFLVAVTVGYETTIRLGQGFLGRLWFQNFHPTGVCGVFGATAGSGKAMSLDEIQMVNALGIAGSQASGLREARAAGTWSKRFQAGHAAMGGVLASLLAKKGFTGPETIFEGDNGFYRAYAHKGEYDLQEIDAGLGESWELANVSFKMHACCRFCAPIVDAVLQIKKESEIKGEEIREIWVGTFQASIDALTKPEERKFRPRTIVDAQFSLPYCAAVALYKGRAFIQEFTDESIRDEKVLDLASRVTWGVDKESEEKYPQCFSAVVKMKKYNGQEFQAKVDYPKGDPENPATDKDLLEKFQGLAGVVLKGHRCEQVKSAVLLLEETEDIGELTKLLSGSRRRPENRR